MSMPRGVSALLLDIEGTTTPISFVYEVLFPFAREHLETSCAGAGDEAGIADAVSVLRREYDEESRAGAVLPDFGDGAAYAGYLMDQDRKSTGLKTLQGLIWEHGYKSGELRGQVFPDVAGALEAWTAHGLRVRVFSSGSILAQKLLFAHSDDGDLTSYFGGYHDTRTGSKKASGSYATIAQAFGLPAGRILFLSDVVEELDAAAEAGMQTGLTLRPGNKPVPRNEHPIYATFRELSLDAP